MDGENTRSLLNTAPQIKRMDEEHTVPVRALVVLPRLLLVALSRPQLMGRALVIVAFAGVTWERRQSHVWKIQSNPSPITHNP